MSVIEWRSAMSVIELRSAIVLLHRADLHFQDLTFSCYAFAITVVQ